MTLLVLGAVASTLSAGTFASFTASTSNTGSTFSTGTVILSNKRSTSANTSGRRLPRLPQRSWSNCRHWSRQALLRLSMYPRKRNQPLLRLRRFSL